MILPMIVAAHLVFGLESHQPYLVQRPGVEVLMWSDTEGTMRFEVPTVSPTAIVPWGSSSVEEPPVEPPPPPSLPAGGSSSRCGRGAWFAVAAYAAMRARRHPP